MLNWIGSELRESRGGGWLNWFYLLPFFYTAAAYTRAAAFVDSFSRRFIGDFCLFIEKSEKELFQRRFICGIWCFVADERDGLSVENNFEFLVIHPLALRVVVSRDVWRISCFHFYLFSQIVADGAQDGAAHRQRVSLMWTCIMYSDIYSRFIKSTWTICRPKRAASCV